MLVQMPSVNSITLGNIEFEFENKLKKPIKRSLLIFPFLYSAEINSYSNYQNYLNYFRFNF